MPTHEEIASLIPEEVFVRKDAKVARSKLTSAEDVRTFNALLREAQIAEKDRILNLLGRAGAIIATATAIAAGARSSVPEIPYAPNTPQQEHRAPAPEWHEYGGNLKGIREMYLADPDNPKNITKIHLVTHPVTGIVSVFVSQGEFEPDGPAYRPERDPPTLEFNPKDDLLNNSPNNNPNTSTPGAKSNIDSQ